MDDGERAIVLYNGGGAVAVHSADRAAVVHGGERAIVLYNGGGAVAVYRADRAAVIPRAPREYSPPAPPLRPADAGVGDLDKHLKRVKAILSQPFAIVCFLYPLAITISMSARRGKMSLVNSRPQDTESHRVVDGPDAWVTTDPIDMLVAGAWFLIVLAAHVYIISNLLMEAPKQTPTMTKPYSWVAPGILTLMTFAYFVTYMSISRYGIGHQQWYLLGTFSIVLFLISLCMIICPPIKEAKVIAMAASSEDHGNVA